MLKYGVGLPGSISAALFGELIDFGSPTPVSIATAFRAICTLARSITRLVPELNLLTLVTNNDKMLLREIRGPGIERKELALYAVATAPQIASHLQTERLMSARAS